MSTGTPSPFARTRPQLGLAPSRTARPVSGVFSASRPLRIDLADGGWPTESDGRATASDASDRAAAQAMVLRSAVEEAAAADRAVRAHNAELAQRMAQGARFAADLDERIARAGQAAGIVEKAAGALAAMDVAVQRVRGAQEEVTRQIEGRMSEQERVLTERLAVQEATFEQRMARQQEVFERRIGEMSGQFEEAIARLVMRSGDAHESATRAIGEHRKGLVEQSEQVCATADRHVAQAQARCSLIVDGVADRIDVLQQQVQRIGTEAQENLDGLCRRAAEVLGHDPRSDFTSEPRLGSLAEAAQRADALVLGVDEAAVRIAALRGDAERVLGELRDASGDAARLRAERAPGLETLRASLDTASAQASIMHQTLDDALHRQQEAAERAAQASRTLSRQREDLAAIAEAGRYHVEQCRGAEATLRGALEESRVRSAELERAAAEVRGQAESMVGLAREAAGLVEKARTGGPTVEQSPQG